jgi:hypothetical protein
LGLYPGPGLETGTSGLGVRAEFTLTRRVEIEGRLTWFPANVYQDFQSQGGKTLQAAAGIRGKLFVAPRFSVYGLFLPGLLHFTNTVTGVVGRAQIKGRATHFALDTGLGVELYPLSRWSVRAEVSGPVYGAPGGELARDPGPRGDATLSILPKVRSLWQVSTGVGYRFGALRDLSVEMPVAGRWEVGGQAATTTTVRPDATELSLTRIPTLGTFMSYKLAPSIYADGAVNASLRSTVSTPFEGGYLLQALGGVKLGVRKDQYGVFAKTRVGVNSHSEVLRSVDPSIPRVTTGRSNAVALDIGGVVERYLGRQWLIRFDGSDVISVFHATTITVEGLPTPLDAPKATHSLQMTVGFGWRF